MGNLFIRNIPDEAVECLRAEAKANGRSVQVEVRHILAAAVRQIQKKRALERLAATREKLRGKWTGPSVLEMLREDRDR